MSETYHDLWTINEIIEQFLTESVRIQDPLPATISAVELNRLQSHTYHSAISLRRAIRARMFTLEQQAANDSIPGLS